GRTEPGDGDESQPAYRLRRGGGGREGSVQVGQDGPRTVPGKDAGRDAEEEGQRNRSQRGRVERRPEPTQHDRAGEGIISLNNTNTTTHFFLLFCFRACGILSRPAITSACLGGFANPFLSPHLLERRSSMRPNHTRLSVERLEMRDCPSVTASVL